MIYCKHQSSLNIKYFHCNITLHISERTGYFFFPLSGEIKMKEHRNEVVISAAAKPTVMRITQLSIDTYGVTHLVMGNQSEVGFLHAIMYNTISLISSY